MSTYNIRFYGELTKIILQLSSNLFHLVMLFYYFGLLHHLERAEIQKSNLYIKYVAKNCKVLKKVCGYFFHLCFLVIRAITDDNSVENE